MWPILSILIIIAYVWILYYLLRLEQIGCKCALNWRRTYIMGFIIFILISQFLLFFAHKNIMALAGLGLVFFIASIANIVIMLQYVHYLKEEKCKCSEADGRLVMEIVAIFQAVVFIFGILAALFFGSTIFKAVKKAKRK